MIKMYVGLPVKYPLFLLHFNETWIFSTNFMKIRLVWAELFHADGRTDGQTYTTKPLFAVWWRHLITCEVVDWIYLAQYVLV